MLPMLPAYQQRLDLFLWEDFGFGSVQKTDKEHGMGICLTTSCVGIDWLVLAC